MTQRFSLPWPLPSNPKTRSCDHKNRLHENKKLSKRPWKIADHFRVNKGKNFRLKDVDPNDTLQFTNEETSRGQRKRSPWCCRPGRVAGQTVRAGQVGCSPDFSSDGCRRQGWRDQARHVGRKSPGLPGLFIQITLSRRSRPRLSLALHEVPARIAATSESSIAVIMKRCSWCGCTRNSWKSKNCRRNWWARGSGRTGSKTFAISNNICRAMAS